MEIGEFRPRQRNHFGGSVELHGAGPERNHAPIERKIAVGKPAHVTQQLGLRAILVEDLVGQKFAVAQQPGRDSDRIARALARPFRRLGRQISKHAPHPLDHFHRRCFVAADPDARRAKARGDVAEIDTVLDRACEDGLAPFPDLDSDRVEESRRTNAPAQRHQARLETGGRRMHAARNRQQALGTVIDRIHRSNHGQQDLRRANVRCRLLAPDVLLAGLQRQPVGLIPATVDRNAD